MLELSPNDKKISVKLRKNNFVEKNNFKNYEKNNGNKFDIKRNHINISRDKLQIDEQLCNAVRENNLQKVDNLLKSGANPNFVDSYGNTLLHISIEKRNFNILEKLLKTGANPNVPNNKKVLPIVHAIKSFNNKLLVKLLEYKANPNLTLEDNKNTPLFYAITKGSVSSIKLLLEKGANPNQPLTDHKTHLMYAIEENNKPIIDELLKHNLKLSMVDSFGDNALMVAAKVGNINVIKNLVSRNLNINFANKKTGKTPLHYSTKYSHFDVVKYLVGEGAKVNSKDSNGKTPIFDVVPEPNKWYIPQPTTSRSDIADFLLQNKADLKPYDTDTVFLTQLLENLNLKYPEHATKLLFRKVDSDWHKNERNNVSNKLKKFESIKKISNTDLDKVLLKLLHPDIEYNNDVDATRHAAHLRSWKGFVNRKGKSKVDGEGWWVQTYAPLKIKPLLKSFIRIKNNEINCKEKFGLSKYKIMDKIKDEISAQMSTYYSQRHQDMMKIIQSSKFKNDFINHESKRYCKEILATPVGKEFAISSGYPGHAMYIGFRKKSPNKVDRVVYNLGECLEKHIVDPEMRVYPHLVKNINSELFSKEKPEAIEYLNGVLIAKLGEKIKNPIIDTPKDPTGPIYEGSKILGGEYPDENTTGIAQKRQTTGNCVLKNNNVATRNRLKNDMLFKWLKGEETNMADEIAQIDKEIIKEKEMDRSIESFYLTIANYLTNKKNDISENKALNSAINDTVKLLEKRVSPFVLSEATKLRDVEKIAYYLKKVDKTLLNRMMEHNSSVMMFSKMAEQKDCSSLLNLINNFHNNAVKTISKMNDSRFCGNLNMMYNKYKQNAPIMNVQGQLIAEKKDSYKCKKKLKK